MKNKIEELKEEKNKLIKARVDASAEFTKRIKEIDDLLWLEKINTAEEMVGKCFVFRNNCYSCPKTKDDYWDTYYKIKSLHRAVDNNDYDYFCALQIEKDCNGRIALKEYHECIEYGIFRNNSQYVEVSPEEFDKQFNKLLKEIAGVHE